MLHSNHFKIVSTHLQDLSSNPEKPGIADKPLCDDGWLDTYGYILLWLLLLFCVDDAVIDDGEFGLSSDVFNGLPSDADVCNDKLLWLFCWCCCWLKIDDAGETEDEMCELINGWNCVYFGSILSNRNFDIAHNFPLRKLEVYCSTRRSNILNVFYPDWIFRAHKEKEKADTQWKNE